LFQQTIKSDRAHAYRGEKMKRGKIVIILATATALALTLFGVAYASYLNYNNIYQKTLTQNTPQHPETTSGAGLSDAPDGATINPTATSTKHQATTQHNHPKPLRLNQTQTKAITPTELDAVAGAGKPTSRKQTQPKYPFLF
jgi:type VI protein secretion system component VasK